MMRPVFLPLPLPLCRVLWGALGMVGAGMPGAAAAILPFNKIVAGTYEAPASRGGCFRLAMDGVGDTGDSGRGFITRGTETGGTAFAGLIRTGEGAVPQVVDEVTLFLGSAYPDGQGFTGNPRLYLLISNTDTGTTPPETSPHWVEAPAIGGYNILEKWWRFHLTGPAAERRVYGFAVSGVPGPGNASFISVSELRAEGNEAPPAGVEPLGRADRLLASAASSWGGSTPLQERATDGVIDPDGGVYLAEHAFDTFAGSDGVAVPDFAGLMYDRQQILSTVTLSYGYAAADGGKFAEPPRLFLSRDKQQTGNESPVGNTHWREVTTAVRTVDPDGVTFDLTGLKDMVRRGYGWVIGGVNGTGTWSCVGVSELSASGWQPATSPDVDGDEMEDAWEQQHGFIVGFNDGGLDRDSDGLSNLGEFQNGTDPARADTDRDGQNDGLEVRMGMNPLDPRSSFRILETGIQGQSLLIRWSAGIGRRYRMQESTNLVNWSDFGPNHVGPDWGFLSALLPIPNPSLPKKYYRIRFVEP